MDHDKLPESAKLLMTPSLIRILLLSLCWWIFTSCVGASNWLSGPTQFQNSPLELSQHFAPVQIGVTTKQKIIERLGNPTNRQIHSSNGIQGESLSYSITETEIRPYQYIPLLGAMAFLGPIQSQTPSAAISFSSVERVSGLTLSTVNSYGDIRSPEFVPLEETSSLSYGMRNPDVAHNPDHSTHKIP